MLGALNAAGEDGVLTWMSTDEQTESRGRAEASVEFGRLLDGVSFEPAKPVSHFLLFGLFFFEVNYEGPNRCERGLGKNLFRAFGQRNVIPVTALAEGEELKGTEVGAYEREDAGSIGLNGRLDDIGNDFISRLLFKVVEDER